MAEAGTILFVEDNDTLRDVLARVLERGGYRVIQAASAESAFEQLPAAGPIDLTVTDVVMPGAGVRGLVERVCTQSPGCRFLVISGHAIKDLERLYGVRDAAFLQKPFTPQAFLERVHGLLGQP